MTSFETVVARAERAPAVRGVAERAGVHAQVRDWVNAPAITVLAAAF